MKRRTDMKKKDDAVSPVIGVMLMLVVTIIIAAVVSGMAGGLISGREVTPSVSVDAKVCAATDKYTPGTAVFKFLSVSEPIKSENLEFVFSYMKDGTLRTGKLSAGDEFRASGKGIANLSSGNTHLGNYTVYGGTVLKRADLTFICTTSGEHLILDATNMTGAWDDLIEPDDATNSTWNGLSDKYYPDYSKLGNSGGAPPGYAYYMVKWADGYSLGYKNKDPDGNPAPNVYTILRQTPDASTTKWDSLEPGDAMTVQVVYTPTGTVLYSKTLVVS